MTSMRRRLTRTGSPALALALALALPGPIGAAELSGPVAADTRVDHVVAISIDGLRPRTLRQLGREGARALHRMRRQGAGTFHARTLREQTVTLPNHTTMLTGLRSRTADGHGVTMNSDPGGTVHDLAGRTVPSMLSAVEDRGGSTLVLAAKDKFHLFHRSWPDAGFRVRRDRGLVDDLVDRIRAERPIADLTFLHLAAPDLAGHRYGFLSRGYRTAVQRSSRRVGRVLRALADDPGSTTVLLTSDHGGGSDGHGDPRRRANFRVPFLAWGAGVARGEDLYRLNPHLEHPGRKRSRYVGAQPVRNGDMANLALDLLGLPAIEGSRFNTDQELRLSR